MTKTKASSAPKPVKLKKLTKRQEDEQFQGIVVILLIIIFIALCI